MPINHAIWKLGDRPARLLEERLENEAELEEMLARDLSVVSGDWLLIGRQVATAYGKYIDLLAIDATGSLIILELKKHRTPRDVVAQAIDYASWVQQLEANEIAEIFERFQGTSGDSLDTAFQARFGQVLDEEILNSSHQMVIVAAELDSSTERIVRYLNDLNVAINVVFFGVFADGSNRYLSRAWFIDPSETQERATAPRGSEPWNGEFYVSFGHNMGRDWEDARRYGFVSAGGGRWYTRTLNKLSPGDRVWVNIGGVGYVGVGIVSAPAVRLSEFGVDSDNGRIPFLDADVGANYHREFMDDEEKSEYFVAIKWLKTVSVDDAVSETGFFGNQNTVAQPTSAKWPHTVERVAQAFGIALAS